MDDKDKAIADIKVLHDRLLSEMDKVIFKLNNYSRQQLAEHQDSEKAAMDQILKKIKEDL